MISLGEHWEFITAAYAGTGVVVALLIGWTMLSARQAKRRVVELEAARQARRSRA